MQILKADKNLFYHGPGGYDCSGAKVKTSSTSLEQSFLLKGAILRQLLII